MLYVTTRNNKDAFTAYKVMRENRAPDGGFYLPFQEPRFSDEEIRSLATKPFGQCVAEVLNILFQTELSAWDVDFSVGRYPVRIKPLSNRILIGETWHNPDWHYDRLVKNLSAQLGADMNSAGDWTKIAVRAAVLFGLYGQLLRQGIVSADISMVSGDFTAPISALYARNWGLPIGNIICVCNENKNLWELISYGQLRTDSVCIPTFLPKADVVVPDALERLIYSCGGVDEVQRYQNAVRSGKTYIAGETMLSKLRDGLFVSVVSSQRVLETIPGVYHTHSYLMTSATALCYAGMLDYRAKQGESRPVVVWSEESPICELESVANVLGVPKEILEQKLK